MRPLYSQQRVDASPVSSTTHGDKDRRAPSKKRGIFHGVLALPAQAVGLRQPFREPCDKSLTQILHIGPGKTQQSLALRHERFVLRGLERPYVNA